MTDHIIGALTWVTFCGFLALAAYLIDFYLETGL